MKGQNNFWQQNAFLTCSWRFLRSNEIEQLVFKLEKNIGIKKHAGKVRKSQFLRLCAEDVFVTKGTYSKRGVNDQKKTAQFGRF